VHKINALQHGNTKPDSGNIMGTITRSRGAYTLTPGVSMNNATNQLFVTAQGTDNQLWMTHQTLGASSWPGWSPMGAFTENTPHSAACANGNMVVSVIAGGGNGNLAFAKFDGWGNQQSGWAVDSEFPVNFDSGIQLTANGNNVYALADLDGSGLWRMIYACN
jgi:hypothetical protein